MKKAGLIQTQTKIGVTGLMKNPEEISLFRDFYGKIQSSFEEELGSLHLPNILDGLGNHE